MWTFFFFILTGISVSSFSQDNSSDTSEVGIPDSPDRIFLDALLEKGLFRLAEIHCQQRMKSPECSAELQAELTMEWMRVIMEHSLISSEKEQSELREQAEKILTDFRQTHASSPWLPVVEYQWSICLLAAAERKCLEGQMEGEHSAKLEESRVLLRQVIKLLKTLDKTLENIPMDAPTKKKSSGKNKTFTKAWHAPEERFSQEGLSVWECISLRNNIQYHLLLALKCQGESYPSGSNDRIHSLQQALTQVQFLIGISRGSSLKWKIDLAEIACLRLLGLDSEAKNKLREIEKLPMTDSVRREFLAEKLRTILATDDLKSAHELWKQEFSPEEIGKSGTLDCAFLEFLISMWIHSCHEGSEKQTIQHWRETAFHLRDEIRRKDSPLWAFRAEILLSKMLDSEQNSQDILTDDLKTLTLLAENAYRSGNTDRTVRACARAWEKAVADNDAITGENVAVLAAIKLYHDGRFTEALKFYRSAATTFPDHPNSIKNHLNAIFLSSEITQDAMQQARLQTKLLEEWNTKAKTDSDPKEMESSSETLTPPGSHSESELSHSELKLSPSETESSSVHKTGEEHNSTTENEISDHASRIKQTQNAMKNFHATMDFHEKILVEHYQFWGQKNPKITEILNQLNNILRLRGKIKEAVDVSMLLVKHTPHDAVEFTERLHSAIQTRNIYLTSLQKQGAGNEAELTAAVRRALAWSQTVLKTLPESEDRHYLMLQNARWRLEYLPQTAPEAEKTLFALLHGSDHLSQQTQIATRCLLILATVIQGRDDHVSEMLREITEYSRQHGTQESNLSSLLTTLKVLQQFTETASDTRTARQYAKLQLTVAELLEKDAEKLPDDTKNQLHLALAHALVILGQTGEALSIYENISAKFPKNRAVQTTYAQLLTENGEKTKNNEILRKAQAQWRNIEKRSPQKSESWFQAKYEIMRIYILLGEKDTAKKLFETLRVLYPDLGGTATQKKIKALFISDTL
ncbi:MAG: tetratricopeptide repeat protein [Planctomycetia bacterium]|nr:tetratricopeptide repeat protein [Planctomycetia bacterium]